MIIGNAKKIHTLIEQEKKKLSAPVKGPELFGVSFQKLKDVIRFGIFSLMFSIDGEDNTKKEKEKEESKEPKEKQICFMTLEEAKAESMKINKEIYSLFKRDDLILERIKQIEKMNEHVTPILESLHQNGIDPNEFAVLLQKNKCVSKEFSFNFLVIVAMNFLMEEKWCGEKWCGGKVVWKKSGGKLQSGSKWCQSKLSH